MPLQANELTARAVHALPVIVNTPYQDYQDAGGSLVTGRPLLAPAASYYFGIISLWPIYSASDPQVDAPPVYGHILSGHSYADQPLTIDAEVLRDSNLVGLSFVAQTWAVAAGVPWILQGWRMPGFLMRFKATNAGAVALTRWDVQLILSTV